MESVDTQHSTELLDNLQIRTFDAFLLKGPRPSDVTPVKGFHIYNLSCPGSLVHLCPRMSLRLIQLLASLDIISSTNSSWRASTPSAGRSFMGPGPPPLTEEVQPRQCRLLGKWGNRFVMDLRG